MGRGAVVRGGALLVALAVVGCSTPETFEGPVIAYENGRWWTGEGFELGSRTVAEGMFVDAPPARADSVVDLEGRWITPPFGDAHTHNLDGDTTTAREYVREGVFYVQVLTNTTRGAERVKEGFAGPETLDVVYANGGISSEYGHPLLAYEARAMGLDWWEFNEHRAEICESRIMEGNAYWFIDDEAELAETWPRIMESSPGILKVYLLHSDDPRPTGCDRMGLTGMRPELAGQVVERARAAGIEVWAHVENAADLRAAAEIGVKGLAHLPGYGLEGTAEEYRIDAATAVLAGERGMVVAPTLQLLSNYVQDDSTAFAARRDLQRENLRTWMAGGGRVVIGSDFYGRTARGEVEAFEEIGLWTNWEILKIWSEETPRAIFPGRRIGSLAPGYEASWLALACDPLDTLDCLEQIERRVKQGFDIEPAESIAVEQP